MCLTLDGSRPDAIPRPPRRHRPVPPRRIPPNGGTSETRPARLTAPPRGHVPPPSGLARQRPPMLLPTCRTPMGLVPRGSAKTPQLPSVDLVDVGRLRGAGSRGELVSGQLRRHGANLQVCQGSRGACRGCSRGTRGVDDVDAWRWRVGAPNDQSRFGRSDPSRRRLALRSVRRAASRRAHAVRARGRRGGRLGAHRERRRTRSPGRRDRNHARAAASEATEE